MSRRKGTKENRNKESHRPECNHNTVVKAYKEDKSITVQHTEEFIKTCCVVHPPLALIWKVRYEEVSVEGLAYT